MVLSVMKLECQLKVTIRQETRLKVGIFFVKKINLKKTIFPSGILPDVP